MPVAVLHGYQAECGDLKPGLLANLLLGVGADGFAEIDPAAGERPSAAFLMNEQNLSVVGGGGKKAGWAARGGGGLKRLHSLKRKLRLCGEHFRGEFADALKTFRIIGIFGIGHTRLPDELKLHRLAQKRRK